MTVFARLLGVAQDGGLPQPGCHCPNCRAARQNPALKQQVVSLGVVDSAADKSWLIDATPDFPAQYDALTAEAPLAGILLTHAHIGHYPGLMYLGPEAMNARQMPVYATPRMAAFLRTNAPWSALVAGDHIRLIEINPGQRISLTPELHITPVAVPHRDEYSDTVGYLLSGPEKRLFYCPDSDHWRGFAPTFAQWLAGVHIALLDGTFFSADELPSRDLSKIPHPLITETGALLAGAATRVAFIHMNHSNPVWHSGPERAWLEARKMEVGVSGQEWRLG